MHCEELFRAGMLAISTVGEPGTHGATVTGMHAPGVRTPRAAAVCAAVTGFNKLVHTPNGMTFISGTLSMMLAAGTPPIIVRFAGRTTSVDGAIPIVQSVVAPFTTGMPMRRTILHRTLSFMS